MMTLAYVFLLAVAVACTAVRVHINHPCQHPVDPDIRAAIYREAAPGLDQREQFILATGLKECGE